MTLISVGWNRKLGPGVGSFSVPVGTTCPGRSEFCALACYAAKGHFTFPSNVQKYASNLRAQKREDFVERVVKEIRASNVRDFRIHVSGDFADVRSVRQWIAIIEALPKVNFWAYTRSWRLGGTMLCALEKLRALPNMALYASMDDTIHDAPPVDWPIAWTGDIIQMGLGTLCPAQSSGGKMTCSSCRLCIDSERDVTFIRH